MNGSVNGSAIKMTVNNTTLTGILSADNMIITWSNGSEWYREIRGSWKNKDGENKNVEQAGNIIRIKNTKGEVEFLGFIKSNGLTLINKSNSNSVSGTLSSIQQITWSDGSVWTK
jgi:osmotically-inducible protein OsmY